jgi:hypothetical protein
VPVLTDREIIHPPVGAHPATVHAPAGTPKPVLVDLHQPQV